MNRYCITWDDDRHGWVYTNNHGADWHDLEFDEIKDVSMAALLAAERMGVRTEDISFVD